MTDYSPAPDPQARLSQLKRYNISDIDGMLLPNPDPDGAWVHISAVKRLVGELEAEVSTLRTQLDQQRKAEAVYHDIIAELHAIQPIWEHPSLAARVEAVLVGCDKVPTFCKEFQDAVEGKLAAEAALTEVRARLRDQSPLPAPPPETTQE